MKAVLIDPFTETISEIDVDYENRSIHAIYEAIGQEGFDMVCLVPEEVYLYVDGEGLYRENQRYFRLVEDPFVPPFAGRGVVLGHQMVDSGEGYEEPDTGPLDTDRWLPLIKATCTWVPKTAEFVGLEDTVEENVEVMPGSGVMGVKITRTPKFRGD